MLFGWQARLLIGQNMNILVVVVSRRKGSWNLDILGHLMPMSVSRRDHIILVQYGSAILIQNIRHAVHS